MPYVSAKGYNMLQIPKQRKSLKLVHLLCLLRGLELPEVFMVDHINGDVSDDRECNLRIVDAAINCKNRKRRSDNTSGTTGIRWSEERQLYIIRKTIKGTRLSTSRKGLESAKQVLADFIDQDGDYTERHGK